MITGIRREGREREDLKVEGEKRQEERREDRALISHNCMTHLRPFEISQIFPNQGINRGNTKASHGQSEMAEKRERSK